MITAAVAEALEPRRLLAGIESGILVARGTAGADLISTQRTGADDVIVTTNGVSQTFDMDNFTGVRLEGLGGNDTFRLIDPLVSPIVRNTTVLGGAGNDVLDYSSRTTSLRFNGYEEGDGDASTPFPFATITSGAQEDRADTTVEHFIGGSAGDSFGFDGLFIDDPFTGPVLTLEGRGGDDRFGHNADISATMHGGAGNDSFEFDDERTQGRVAIGGDGNDTFSLNNEGFSGSINAGAGIDRLTTFGSFKELIDIRPFIGLENVEGVRPGRTIIGNDLNNHISVDPNENADVGVTLRGMGGNDSLIGGGADDLLEGGAGNDYLDGNVGDDTLDGGEGTDTVDGGPGGNTITNAEITPAAPNIRIASRILTVDGSWGRDLITIERTGGDDVIVRVNNTSRQFDMDNFDGVLLRGNAGWDDLRVIDPIVAGSLGRKVTLDGGGGDDTLTGSDGDDVLRGGDGNDQIDAGLGNDALFGGGGDDGLVGSVGLDFMDGGDGNDFLGAREGSGGDTVLGGNGTDRASVDAGDQVSGVETFV
jgi:Ca2+-binding RTX toxin-like protein